MGSGAPCFLDKFRGFDTSFLASALSSHFSLTMAISWKPHTSLCSAYVIRGIFMTSRFAHVTDLLKNQFQELTVSVCGKYDYSRRHLTFPVPVRADAIFSSRHPR